MKIFAHFWKGKRAKISNSLRWEKIDAALISHKETGGILQFAFQFIIRVTRPLKHFDTFFMACHQGSVVRFYTTAHISIDNLAPKKSRTRTIFFPSRFLKLGKNGMLAMPKAKTAVVSTVVRLFSAMSQFL